MGLHPNYAQFYSTNLENCVGGRFSDEGLATKQEGLIDEIKTYDFKLKNHIIRKLDARVKFTDSGEPQVVAIKKA